MSICTCGGIIGADPKWCAHCSRQSESRLHRAGPRPSIHYIKPHEISAKILKQMDVARRDLEFVTGIDLSSKPDMTATAISSGAGCIRVVHGRRAAHEALCVPLVRARRMAEGRPPAQWVVVCWRQKQRILRHAKQLALNSKLRLHRPFGGEPSAS